MKSWTEYLYGVEESAKKWAEAKSFDEVAEELHRECH